MTQIILDSVTRGKLKDFREPVDLCDEAGKVFARLIPVLDPSQYEPYESPLSPEELERRRQEPDYSTAEVRAYLQSL